MRFLKFSILALIFFSYANFTPLEKVSLFRGQSSLTGFAYAQGYEQGREEDTQPLRPGMELKKIGGVNIIVPEGTEIYKDGNRGLFFLEGPDEYVGRRFKETEIRFEKIEKEQRELKARIKHLEEMISKLEKGLEEK